MKKLVLSLAILGFVTFGALGVQNIMASASQIEMVNFDKDPKKDDNKKASESKDSKGETKSSESCAKSCSSTCSDKSASADCSNKDKAACCTSSPDKK
jgi:hypothetical protein